MKKVGAIAFTRNAFNLSTILFSANERLEALTLCKKPLYFNHKGAVLYHLIYVIFLTKLLFCLYHPNFIHIGNFLF